MEIEGSFEARDCAVHYRLGDRTLAVATISRDLESLQAERMMEAGAAAGAGRRGG